MASPLRQVRRVVPVKKGDPLAAIIFGLVALFAITGVDLIFHDTFVLNTYHCDDPKNAGLEECKAILSQKSVSLSIENTTFEYKTTGRGLYWVVLNMLIFIFSAMPALMRGYFLGSIKAGTLWFMTILLPILGGYEDFAYFAAKGEAIPAEMPWLNENVFISLFAGGQTVTATTLYISMAAVVVILAIGWALALRRK